MTDPKLWLAAAVYRIVADPYGTPADRSDLRFVFNEWADMIDPIVDALVEYGAVREPKRDGALTAAAYLAPDPVPPRHLLFD